MSKMSWSGRDSIIWHSTLFRDLVRRLFEYKKLEWIIMYFTSHHLRSARCRCSSISRRRSDIPALLLSWPEAPALANALHVFTLALLASFPLLERPTIQKRHIAAVESINSLISVRSIYSPIARFLGPRIAVVTY